MSDNVKSLLKSLPTKISTQASKIISDYSSGSQELNEEILLLLLRSRSIKTIKNLILIFGQTFQKFAVIQNTLNRLERELQESDLQRLKSLIKKILNTQKLRFEKLFKKFQKKIFRGIKILAFSNSYTCLKLFESIYKHRFDPEIYILQSNPGGEGKIFYRKLKEIGICSHLIPDERLEEIISKIDIVIFGADQIFPDHYIINKIGTGKIARLARKYSKPVYVVSLKEKVIRQEQMKDNFQVSIRKKDEQLFEKVKIDLITEIFIA